MCIMRTRLRVVCLILAHGVGGDIGCYKDDFLELLGSYMHEPRVADFSAERNQLTVVFAYARLVATVL